MTIKTAKQLAQHLAGVQTRTRQSSFSDSQLRAIATPAVIGAAKRAGYLLPSGDGWTPNGYTIG